MLRGLISGDSISNDSERELDNIKGLDLVVGRNFSHTFQNNVSMLKHHVELEWIELNRQAWDPTWPSFEFFAGYHWPTPVTQEQKISKRRQPLQTY